MWQLAVQVLLATVVLSVPTDPRCPLEHKPDSAVLYEHNDNCNKFYMCLSNRTIVERNCPAGLQFDVDSSVGIILWMFSIRYIARVALIYLGEPIK